MALALLLGAVANFGIGAAVVLNRAGRTPHSSENQSIPKVVFLHPRKTGGSSLNVVLFGQQGSEDLVQTHDIPSGNKCKKDPVCSIQSWPEPYGCSPWNLETQCAERIDELIANDGRCPHVELHHFDISAAALLRGHGYSVLTIVRDPIRQLESAFNYEFYSRPGAFLPAEYKMLANTSGSLAFFEAWASERNGIFEQMRMFSACSPKHCSVKPTGAGMLLGQALKDYQATRTSRKLLDAEQNGVCSSAKSVYGVPPKLHGSFAELALNRSIILFDRIVDTGLVLEEWETSLYVLASKYKVPAPEQWLHAQRKENPTVYKHRVSELPALVQEQLKERLQFEYRLYNHAVLKFLREVKRLGLTCKRVRCGAPVLR